MVPSESPVVPELLKNAPALPVVAARLPACTSILAAFVPMDKPVAWLVLMIIAPEPTFKSVPAVCVMSPPLEVTVKVPPLPVVMLRKPAMPVPPPAVFTLIATALLVVFVVVIELPSLMVRSCPPAPSVLAFKVTVPEPVSVAAASVSVFRELIVKLPLVEVMVPPAFCVTLPEAVLLSERVPLPVCKALPIVRPVEPTSVKLPSVVVKLPLVERLPPLLCKVKLPVPVEIAAAGRVSVALEITLKGLLVASVGAASVRLPVFVTKAPPVPAVRVKVPPAEVVANGVPLLPMLLALAVGTESTKLPAVPVLKEPAF